MDEVKEVLETGVEDSNLTVEMLETLLDEADLIITDCKHTIADLTKKVGVSFTTGVICGGAIGAVSVVGGYFTGKKIKEYLVKKKLEKPKQEI